MERESAQLITSVDAYSEVAPDHDLAICFASSRGGSVMVTLTYWVEL